MYIKIYMLKKHFDSGKHIEIDNLIASKFLQHTMDTPDKADVHVDWHTYPQATSTCLH